MTLTAKFQMSKEKLTPKGQAEVSGRTSTFLCINIITVITLLLHTILLGINGNKAKGQIPKRVFQENKACQISRKTNISYSLI